MSKLSKFLIFIILITIYGKSYALPFASIPQKISHYVDKHQSQTTQFLERVTNIDSQTENFAGVRKVGAEFARALQALGFVTYWQDMPKEINRAGNLFAIRTGSKGKRILLIGHLDTVFPLSPNNGFQILAYDPESGKQVTERWAKGIGVSDMKGGDVVLLQALQALHALKLLENTTIAVALMGDEENPAHPTSVSRSELIRLAKQSDVVLDFESGPPSLGRRGVSTWMLTTSGTQQHSSLIFQPQVGSGAVYEIARILSKFAKKFENVENLTVNPGIIYGGSAVNFNQANQSAAVTGKFNIVAKTSHASGDLRYISIVQKLATEKAMEKIVHKHFPQTQATISFKDLVEPMTPNVRNEDLLKKLQAINFSLTHKKLIPLPPNLRGGGDISFIAQYVPAGLVGLGPIGKYEHSTDEIVDLDSIQIASKRVAILMYMLTHETAVTPAERRSPDVATS